MTDPAGVPAGIANRRAWRSGWVTSTRSHMAFQACSAARWRRSQSSKSSPSRSAAGGPGSSSTAASNKASGSPGTPSTA